MLRLIQDENLRLLILSRVVLGMFIIGLTIFMTVLMIALGFAHLQDPKFALTQLQLVPIGASIFYLPMPVC